MLEIDERVNEARDLILSYMNDHEAEDHDGQRCGQTRVGVMGFIGHCLMLNADERNAIVDAIIFHDQHCSEVTHEHDRTTADSDE